eukprot:1417990-Ditylum_brightwellii.AAC.1
METIVDLVNSSWKQALFAPPHSLDHLADTLPLPDNGSHSSGPDPKDDHALAMWLSLLPPSAEASFLQYVNCYLDEFGLACQGTVTRRAYLWHYLFCMIDCIFCPNGQFDPPKCKEPNS